MRVFVTKHRLHRLEQGDWARFPSAYEAMVTDQFGGPHRIIQHGRIDELEDETGRYLKVQWVDLT